MEKLTREKFNAVFDVRLEQNIEWWLNDISLSNMIDEWLDTQHEADIFKKWMVWFKNAIFFDKARLFTRLDKKQK